MANQPVPMCAQLQLEETLDGQTIMQTFYFISAAGWNPTTLLELCTAAETQYNSDFKPLFPSGHTLNRIIATDLSSLEGARVVKPESPPVAGTAAGDYLPLNATLAVHLDIGNRGRGANGRTFWPALMEGNVTGDQVLAAAANDIISAIDGMRSACEAVNDSTMVIVSRWVNGAKRMNGEPRIVTSISVRDTYVDTQKDRLPRHKRRKLKHTP